MKHYIRVIFFLLLGGWWFTGLAADTESARQLVETTANKVLTRVRAEREALRADPKRLHTLVDELLVEHFDFSRTSQWVLGKYWREASPSQREKFTEEFKKLLIRTYASALVEYADNKIRYFPAQQGSDSKTATVKTEVDKPGSSPVPINYRMINKNNAWKVYDVSVDGVSLVSTYRASFAAQIRKSGLDSLIADLVKKNAS